MAGLLDEVTARIAGRFVRPAGQQLGAGVGVDIRQLVMVDLTARYSNRTNELTKVCELLKHIAARDRSGGPGLDGKPDHAPATQPPRPRKLADRLPADAILTIVTQFLDGATVQALATEYGISRSSEE